jgi:hypothetical protein
MISFVDAKADAALKPVDLADLLKVELDLGRCMDMLPKDIISLANEKLGRVAVEGANVKDEAMKCRELARGKELSFWTELKISKSSSPEELVERLLAKPPTVGGFATAVAVTTINPVYTLYIARSCFFFRASYFVSLFLLLPFPSLIS